MKQSVSLSRILYGLAIVVNAILGALAVQLGSGVVPVPDHWAWAVPVLIAGITAATTQLPKLGSSTSKRTRSRSARVEWEVKPREGARKARGKPGGAAGAP